MGDRIGRYELEAQIGRGGYGDVYRAKQLGMERPVALKVLRDRCADADAAARFEREARIAQSLRHPNAVAIIDYGMDPEGTSFIAYELLDGEPLARLLKRDGALTPRRAARIAVQMLKALSEAHALGIVHRDVKPANVFLCRVHGESDFTKLLDFGIAKSLRQDTRFQTSDGDVVGTPAYMAPEHLSGGTITPQTDLYAVGLVIAEMLSGRPVYSGPATDICMQQLSEDEVPLSEVVRASPLGSVVQWATRKDPAARPPSATDLIRALESAIPIEVPISAPIVDPSAVPYAQAPVAPPPDKQTTSAGPVALLLAGGVFLLALGVVGAAVAGVLALGISSSVQGEEYDLAVADKRRVSPDDLLREATSIARRIEPKAGFVGMLVLGLESGSFDATRAGEEDRTALVTFLNPETKKRIVLLVEQGKLRVSRQTPDDDRVVPPPKCDFRRALASAEAKGFPRAEVKGAVVSADKDNGSTTWFLRGSKVGGRIARIDASTCAVLVMVKGK